MKPPTDIERQFFAYGLFRPGQIGFFRLRALVSEVVGPVAVPGSLRERDGLPIIAPDEPGHVRGVLLRFSFSRAAEAYEAIAALEPDNHYVWHEGTIDGAPVNVLVGKSPLKGSVPCEYEEWNGWDDPLFTAALEVVEETSRSESHFGADLKPLFRLQMAYLLLWSAIERYVALRYHLGGDVMAKVGQLAGESAFGQGLQRHVRDRRELYRADRPTVKLVLEPQSPKKSLNYYYQVRNNITHRGKAVVRDHELVRDSLSELLAIFREVLKTAQSDAESDVVAHNAAP